MNPVILVLCTGNSARSQMAEGFLRDRLGERLPVLSAGTDPADEIHQLAVEVMGEKGIDISSQEPSHFREYLGKVPVHTLVVVCDGAAKACPSVWPGAIERLVWPFEDPAAFEGTEEESREKFREVRDALEARIDAWIAALPVKSAG